ncbi:hypothetical protein HS048_33950 [Planomonospora sp. ID91781]|uniref:hypothetical protein n=1 Tax=Planomonospora sp. ID91781 TaxID=2738135 RepID=UPI0018C44451|nr:hypothetical protein [Planomonospora sp. ID91781]MBG0825690.1 hypothetical protein [Planomonospora sp. ID91781]
MISGEAPTPIPARGAALPCDRQRQHSSRLNIMEAHQGFLEGTAPPLAASDVPRIIGGIGRLEQS